MEIENIGPFAIALVLLFFSTAFFYYYLHRLLIEKRLIRYFRGWIVKFDSEFDIDDENHVFGYSSMQLEEQNSYSRLSLISFSPAPSSLVYRYLAYQISSSLKSGIYGGRGLYISVEYQQSQGKRVSYDGSVFVGTDTELALMRISECCIVEEGNAIFYIPLPQLSCGRVERRVARLLTQTLP